MKTVRWNSIELFIGLSEADLAKVREIFHTVDVPAGDRVIVEGDMGDEMFILTKGKVRVLKSMIIEGMALPLTELKGAKKVLATLGGEMYPFFGEMALLDRDKRSATVECLEDCSFLCTNRERFFTLVNQEPAVGCRMLMALGKRLTSRLRHNNAEVVKLTTALALALGHGNAGGCR